jgi:hypothetical protein
MRKRECGEEEQGEGKNKAQNVLFMSLSYQHLSESSSPEAEHFQKT